MYSTYLGIFFGALTRTIVPYILALHKKPRLTWNNKYLISAVCGLLLSLIATILLSSQVHSDLGFLGSFTLAYTLHSLSRDLQKTIGQ